MTRDEMKELLIQAWKDVFDVESVSEDADFFEEGGDSIKAVQLSSWLVQKGVKLDLGKIFYTPVLADMAETLEETDPMYVPDERMTKELIQEKYMEVMSGEPPAPAPAPVSEQESQQLCDPANNAQADQQLCDPTNNAQAGQQLCDPANNAQADQQLCDPANNAQADQQPCDPANNAQAGQAPVWNNGSENMMMPLIRLMISQQQSMLQMLQLILNMIPQPGTNMPPRPAADRFFRPAPARRPSGMPKAAPFGRMPNQKPQLPPVPKEKEEAFRKVMESYQSKKIDKPVDQPNVISVKKMKVEKPQKSAREVLEYVLSTVLKNPLDKQQDLFEQGLSSLDTVKIVTRCGEYGYSVKMQDIYMHSVFEELVRCMVPGEE